MSTAEQLKEFLDRARTEPSNIEFEQTIGIIDACYAHTPSAFSVGLQKNQAGQNTGSGKILAFARLHQLNEEQTLQLFGSYYRNDVLNHPQGNDHANIRQFQLHGWSGVELAPDTLTPAAS